MSRGLAEPGELVVCIDGRFPPQIWEWMADAPVSGEIYTVEKVVLAHDGITGVLGPGYKLEEFRGLGIGGRGPISFSVFRFRRLEHENEEENEDELLDVVGSRAG